MPAELKIVVDVARYRLGRLEMANLGAAAAICFALRLAPREIAIRLAFGAILNLLVYLNNDYLDREEDAEAQSKDASKTEFLRAHAGAAIRAQLGLLGLLGVFALWHGGGLFAVLLLGGGVCWLYSAVLKRHPGVDIAAMIAWGVTMPLVAVPIGNVEGWALLLQLGLFSGVFETIQVLRDHDEDQRLGLRTTAVVLGEHATGLLARALTVAAAAYAGLMFHPLLALPILLAAGLPLGPGNYNRTWNGVRALFGAAFLIECWLTYGRSELFA